MRATSFTTILAVCTLAACAGKLPELPPSSVPTPQADELDSVVFLIGDAGAADYAAHPVLRVLHRDIEAWSGRLARDSSVVVLFLGDNIYPRGLHDVGVESWETDSIILESQVNMLAGPLAREHGSIGYFIPGNHDWGHARDEEGISRLQNMERFLDRRRAAGTHVRLQPEAGEPGPSVLDVGDRLRLLLYDTAWWMLAQSDYKKQRMLTQTEDMVRTTTSRHLVVAAHHPYESAGPHGGTLSLWDGLGLRFLLSRSGAVLQDISSAAYRELREIMLEAFRHGQPLLFVGGHDHNLQIIRHDEFPMPRYSAVSGSGSKSTSVGHREGMMFRSAAPGYMTLFTHRSGRVDLVVTAAGEDGKLYCTGSGEGVEECVAKAMTQFVTRYGVQLK